MLKYFVILNGALLLVPVLAVVAPIVIQRVMRSDSFTEISGSSGELNLAAISIYVALPNPMLYIWTQYNRPR